MTYADITDVQARLPFTLNVNSLPTLANALIILGNCNKFLKGIIDRTVAEPNEDLGVVELELCVEQIRAIHSGQIPSFKLNKDLKIIVDNYRTSKSVGFYPLEFGND